jgi:hypothetical protein
VFLTCIVITAFLVVHFGKVILFQTHLGVSILDFTRGTQEKLLWQRMPEASPTIPEKSATNVKTEHSA